MSDMRFVEQAKEVSLEVGYVSVSWIQRKVHIGYCTAANTVDALVEIGFCEKEYMNGTARRRIISAPNNACIGQVAGAGKADGESTPSATCQ